MSERVTVILDQGRTTGTIVAIYDDGYVNVTTGAGFPNYAGSMNRIVKTYESAPRGR